tara:strand:+ start:948 stop:1436 length:489 start_codon:yes stop_codon:yes gene_type:complete
MGVQMKIEKPEVVLCDIDGTIADCEHRRHHVTGKKKDFKSFYAEQYKDDAIKTTVAVLKALCWQTRYGLIFVSARPEKYRKDTEEWLVGCAEQYKDTPIECLGLLMRPEGDYRADHIVKEEIYLNRIKPHYNVFMVLDDRQKVVDMWRKHGLICHQVADGNF